jgi:hypothetical protein
MTKLNRKSPGAVRPAVVSLAVALAATAVAAPRAARAQAQPAIRRGGVDQPFAWMVDPSTPEEGRASVAYRLGVASGVDAERPLPAAVSAGGTSHQIEMSYGLSDRIAPFAVATLHDGGAASATMGMKLQLTQPSAAFRVTLAAGGLREGLSGDLGAMGRAALAYDTGGLRLAGNFHVEKIFAANRDRFDIITTFGTSYRLASFLRVGAEYVGQDLEDAFGDDVTEGGAKHVVGPSLALDLGGGRYQMNAGVGAGIGPHSPGLLFRAGFSTAF